MGQLESSGGVIEFADVLLVRRRRFPHTCVGSFCSRKSYLRIHGIVPTVLCEERLRLLNALTDATSDLASAMMELRVVFGVNAPEDRYEWAKRAADLAKLNADKLAQS